jgi:hypothetical protein
MGFMPPLGRHKTHDPSLGCNVMSHYRTARAIAVTSYEIRPSQQVKFVFNHANQAKINFNVFDIRTIVAKFKPTLCIDKSALNRGMKLSL